MSAIQEENTVVNAQGEFSRPDFSDPIAIKMDSAKKMSLADKTGNEALKREAAAEQSFADRMGGRSALSKKKQQAGESTEAPAVGSPRTIGMLKSASQPALASKQQGMMKSQSSMKVCFPQASDTTGISKEALALKLDAAAKQSLADRTGDARLKAAAAAEQSLADKLGSTAASRLDLSAFKRPVSGDFSSPPSDTSSSLPQPKLIPLANIDSDGNIILPPTLSAPVSPTPSHSQHVPLPLPSNSSSSTSILMHTCSCCGHTEPFNGGRPQPKRKEEKREDKREEKKEGADADKWLRGQKIPSREELIQKGKSPYQNQTQDKKEGHKRNGSNNGNGGNGNLSRPDPVSPRADSSAPVSPQPQRLSAGSPKSGQRSRPESPANLKVEAMPFLPQQQKSMIPSPSESSITPAAKGSEMVRSASASEINTILIGEGNSAQQLQLRPRRVNNNNRRNKAIKREQAAKEGEENVVNSLEAGTTKM